jgi:amidohydrolase
MDALPIMEETGAEYASQHPGVMHACGHDGHTAVGLTVAHLLHAHRDELAGTVKLVFQPAEEGLGGAKRMVKEGVLENPRPDTTLALHFWNNCPMDWLGVSAGPTMAAAERFYIRIIGKGGHGAAPQLAVDPVLASAQIITALQSIVARNVPPLETAVVSVTTVHAGDAFNVIPSETQMEGTIRTFDPAVRQTVLDRFDQIVRGTAETFGCQAEIEMEMLTPAVVNDPQVARKVKAVAQDVLPDAEIGEDFHTMGSEDMAYMMQVVPGCYFFVGSANSDKGLDAAHHHPRFDFDEEALPRAAALMTAAAIDVLKK